MILRIVILRIVILLVLWILIWQVDGWVFAALAIAGAIVTYFVFSRVLHLYGSPWRRIYFPIMDRYAFISGGQLWFADANPGTRDGAFHPRQALRVVMKELWPQVSENEIEAALLDWEIQFDSGVADEPFFRNVLQELSPSHDVSQKIPLLQAELHRGYNAMFVRYVVGEIIGAQFGDVQKTAFWKAVLTKKIG